MPGVEMIRNDVPERIYRRGERYYNSGRIVFYDLEQAGENFWFIEAAVKGTTRYRVVMNVKVGISGIKYYGHCTCPYDWGDVCKHQVAVLCRFLVEDHQAGGPGNDAEGFSALEDMARAVRPGEKIELKYYLRGMRRDSMKNFKLRLESEQLTLEELEEIIRYAHSTRGPNFLRSGGYSENTNFASLKKRLRKEDLMVFEYLRQVETSTSQTQGAVLFAKNRSNFNFILNLIENNEVYLAKSEKRAETGKVFYPGLKIKGNEEKVEVRAEREYEIYGQGSLRWAVRGGTIHPLPERNVLPAREIEIPAEKRGRFLFEILPELEENIDVEIDKNLRGHELVKLDPEIELEFDYSEEAVFCHSRVEIDGEVFANAEILELEPEDRHYRRSEEEPRLWFCWNMEVLEELLDYLEYYNFHVRPGSFIIRDKGDIQEFITDGFLHIPEDWDVSTTDAFDEVEIKPVELDPVVEFVGEDDGGAINWFEFTVTYNLGGETYTREELMEMIRYNKQGEAYIQIDDSYFILQETEKEKKIKNALEIAEEGEDGDYRSNYYNLLYYRNLMQEAGISFKGSRVYNDLDRDITEENLIRKLPVPEDVKDVLRDYQKRGYYWLRFLHKYRFGGILADDMGLGKTVQILTFLKSIKPEWPALVICPRTLIYNWGEEIKKFFPDTEYLVYYGSPEEREEMRSRLENYEIIITSYSIISRDGGYLLDSDFSYCILDEAQHIKNPKTKRAKAVKSLPAETRLALTGTPIENSVRELWSIFDFLMPGYLGNRSQFKRKYENPITSDNNKEKLYELKERVAPFILRRKKEEVLQDLPDKLVNIQQVEMTQLQEDAYVTILEEVKRELTETVEELGFNRSQINVLTTLTRLRQICNHPRLVLDDVDRKLTSGKLETLMEIVEEGIAGGHKLVVFSQFVKMLRLIRQQFEHRGIDHEYLDGGTRNRMERVNRFNGDDSIPVFLISLRAGGTGLNLTGADMVVHVDPWWNPMVERQATDRTHRIGQDKRVVVYKLITRGTVEEKMLKLQHRKKRLFENLIENNVSPMEKLTWEDIQNLLEYN